MTELNNLEAELAVLGIILNNPDLADGVQLKPFMFGTGPLVVIYDCINSLVSQGLVPDFSLVSSKLKADGNLDKAGGLEYLDDIYKDLSYSTDNLQAYCNQVESAYKARSIISLTTAMGAKAKNTNDIDSVITELETGIANIQDNASSDGFSHISDVTKDAWKALEERLKDPGVPGITTGINTLDLLSGGYRANKLWIVAGRPGIGKTSDMCNSVLKCAEELQLRGENEHVIIFSLEMSKKELIYRMLSVYTKVPNQDIIFGTLTQEQVDAIRSGMVYLNTLPIIIDDFGYTQQDRFISVIRKVNRTKKIRIVFFDYLQLGTDRDEGQTSAIGRLTKAGKNIAKEFECTVVFYSQLNRMVELRDDKRPILSDLRQSGNIEEDADIVKFLYRDEYYNKDTKYPGVMEQDLKKNRDGRVGMFTVKFTGETMTVEEDS